MSVRSRRFRSVVAGSALVPLWAFVAAPALADGEQTPPGAQDITRVCEGVPAGYEPFTDVDGNLFEDAILCMAYAKVTRGGPGGAPASNYVPDADVSRDAMASFVTRLMDVADRQDRGDRIRALPAYRGTPAFTDIANNTHVAAISRLAAAGIVTGSPGGAGRDRYVPGVVVTRGQMASFLRRSLEFMLNEPVSTTNDYYTDDRGDVHEPSINAITSLGIATGRSPQTYAPRGTVDRDSMAAFLARTLGELEQRRAVEPLRPPAADEVVIQGTDDRAVNAAANPDSTAADDREYTVTGLAPGEEYRITLVEAKTISRNMLRQPVFTEDGDTGLASVGVRTADIIAVDSARPTNNSGDGTALVPVDPANAGTAVVVAGPTGRFTFVVDLDAGAEAVIPLIYRNGGPTNAAADGGRSARLELNDDGTAAESVTLGGQFGERITVTPDDAATRVAVANPDMLPVDDRTYTVSGLVPGEEYRVTVVDATTTSRRADGETVFTVDGSTGLAAVGPKRTADITSVNGAAPMNNAGDGAAQTANDPADSGTAVFVAGADGRATFVLDLDGRAETVLPVVYRNGGAGNSLADGGTSPRLELGADGVPVEPYDVGGTILAE